MKNEDIKEFNQFLENVLNPIIGIDEKGTIRSLNHSAERTLSLQRSEAIGKPFVDIVITSSQEELEKEIKLIFKANDKSSKQPIEAMIRRRNGTIFPAVISFSLMTINNGSVLYAFIQDISQTKYSIFELRQSEERYRKLVESVADYAIFMLDSSGIIISWNKGAEKIKGYKSEEIIGKHFSVFYLKEDIDSGKTQFELKVAAADGKYKEENWRVRKDGSLFWANILLTALRDEQGRLQGFAKVTRDLTSRRQAEEALKQTQEKYRILIDSLPDYAIFMLDAKGRISSWNKGAERIMGYRTEEIIGEPFEILTQEENTESNESVEILKEALKIGHYEKEDWCIRRDGSKFYANIIINIIMSEAGHPNGFAMIIRDITERRDKKA